MIVLRLLTGAMILMAIPIWIVAAVPAWILSQIWTGLALGWNGMYNAVERWGTW